MFSPEFFVDPRLYPSKGKGQTKGKGKGVTYTGAVHFMKLNGGGGGGKGQHKGKEPPPPPLSRPSEPLEENFQVIIAETMEEVLLYVTPEQAEAARLQARDGDYGMTLFHNGNTLVHLKPLGRPAPID